MENNDNILKEMQMQLSQLKEKLDGEKIVNDRLLRNAYRKTLNGLQIRALRQTIIGIIAMVLCLSLINVGFSTIFVVATEIMLAFCLVATIVINSRLPKMDTDLITAAEGVRRFKKGYRDWLWIGIPLVIIWVAGMCYEIMHSDFFPAGARTTMILGLGVGIVIGGAIGLVMRKSLLNKSDETLAQIEELRGEN
ncbi:MAG: hypothetical protein IKZ50_00760 [Bacteroidales bacterium]|nr:hypothetical protein [Bacteroidales bacterium]